MIDLDVLDKKKKDLENIKVEIRDKLGRLEKDIQYIIGVYVEEKQIKEISVKIDTTPPTFEKEYFLIAPCDFPACIIQRTGIFFYLLIWSPGINMNTFVDCCCNGYRFLEEGRFCENYPEKLVYSNKDISNFKREWRFVLFDRDTFNYATSRIKGDDLYQKPYLYLTSEEALQNLTEIEYIEIYNKAIHMMQDFIMQKNKSVIIGLSKRK